MLGSASVGRPLAVRQHAGVAWHEADDLLARELADLSAGRTDVSVIAGSGLSAPPPGASALASVGRLIVAPPGQPCTGAWWELAGGLSAWQATGQLVLLADYDPALGYACACAIDIASADCASEPEASGKARASEPMAGMRERAGGRQ
jgi:hypothetical protein